MNNETPGLGGGQAGMRTERGDGCWRPLGRHRVSGRRMRACNERVSKIGGQVRHLLPSRNAVQATKTETERMHRWGGRGSAHRAVACAHVHKYVAQHMSLIYKSRTPAASPAGSLVCRHCQARSRQAQSPHRLSQRGAPRLRAVLPPLHNATAHPPRQPRCFPAAWLPPPAPTHHRQRCPAAAAR